MVQPARERTAGREAPAGVVRVVDPHPLNWLFITWNTMEEPVRTDERGRIVGACMEDSWWEGSSLVVRVREGVRFQDGERLTAHSIERAFREVQKWRAPHPPGTYLNFHPETGVEVTDERTIRFDFPEPDTLALAKFRGFHSPSTRFWEEEGFGYRKYGTGEGHW